MHQPYNCAHQHFPVKKNGEHTCSPICFGLFDTLNMVSTKPTEKLKYQSSHSSVSIYHVFQLSAVQYVPLFTSSSRIACNGDLTGSLTTPSHMPSFESSGLGRVVQNECLVDQVADLTDSNPGKKTKSKRYLYNVYTSSQSKYLKVRSRASTSNNRINRISF